MSDLRSFDSLGRPRSPAAVPGYRAGRPLRNKGRRYPADRPRTEEIIAVMRCAGGGLHGARARSLIVVLWRAALRVQEALDLSELDLDPRRGSVLVRCGKGGAPPRSRHGRLGLRPTPALAHRAPEDARRTPVLRHQRTHPRARLVSHRRRFVPHQLRHAHAIELAREGVPLNVIQRQLGHRNLGVTSIYLQGIDPGEIIETVHARAPSGA
jgi:integrase